MSFFSKQFIDVIQWTESGTGTLAYRYPMEDMEIQTGAKLTVRDSQSAVFVNEGRIADVFAPGLYTLSTSTLPILTYLMNWDKAFQSPFKSDVYFFSTRLQTDQKWGTPTPLTIRDKEFGAVRIRAYGIYSYRISNPKIFYEKVSGTRATYHVSELDGQLRNTIVGLMTSAFGTSTVDFLDMAGNQSRLADAVRQQLTPVFANLGLALDSFVVESISLPEELQKMLDQKISMNMLGDMGRYTQFQAAQALPIAAANPGGIAGIGVNIGAGLALGQQMAGAMHPETPASANNPATPSASASSPASDTRFCSNCGHSIKRSAKFCSECGSSQQ